MPSRWPICIKAGLQEFCTASARVWVPWPGAFLEQLIGFGQPSTM